ncbi:transcription elongation factor spt5, partial [Marasmius crinis-equi]
RNKKSKLWPWASGALEDLYQRVWELGKKARDPALEQFLKALIRMRRVLCQDLAVLYGKNPHCFIFEYAPFDMDEFREFASGAVETINAAAKNAKLKLEAFSPEVARVMQGFVYTSEMAFQGLKKEQQKWAQDVQLSMQNLANTVYSSNPTRSRKKRRVEKGGVSTSTPVPSPTPTAQAPFPARPTVVLLPSPPKTPIPEPVQSSSAAELPAVDASPAHTPTAQATSSHPAPLRTPLYFTRNGADVTSLYREHFSKQQEDDMLANEARFGKEKVACHDWDWVSHRTRADEWIPRYTLQPPTSLSCENMWLEYFEGLNGGISVKDLEEKWAARWRASKKGSGSERCRRGKLWELVKELQKRNGWTASMALEFLQDRYPISADGNGDRAHLRTAGNFVQPRTLQASVLCFENSQTLDLKFPSWFLDLEAELDSENDYKDEEDEVHSIVQDDNGFIDNSIEPEAFTPPPLLRNIEEQFLFDEARYTSSRPQEAYDDDPVYTRSLQAAESEGIARVLQDRQFVYGILRHTENPTDRFLNHAINPRAPVPPDARERYAHFQRPQRVLDQPPPHQSSSSSSGASVPDSSLFSSSDTESSSSVQRKRKLVDLSVNSAPHGAFAPKKSRCNVNMKGWTPGEWVKVLRGLYKGNIGIIWKPDSTISGETGYFLLVIPRLVEKASQKHKRERPAPCLFEPANFASEPVEGEDQHTFRFRGKTFSHGLLVKFFQELSIEPFFTSKHPFVRKFPFPLAEFFAFDAGDEVDESGRVGIIREVLSDMGLVDFGADGTHTYPLGLLQKHVVPGDSIKVVSGQHQGEEGLVAERHGSLLYISQRHTKTGVDFFVHINSVKVQQESFDMTPHQDVPWINTKVIITRGRYAHIRGSVKGVRVTRHGDRLALMLYLPTFDCSVETDYNRVVEQDTGKKLLDYQPLTPEQKKFKLDPSLARMRTGSVPWLGTRVIVIEGIHKGKGEGIVRDVNRPSQGYNESGLALSIKMQVISPNANNRIEVVKYACVREVDSGLELAKYMPLSEAQKFYTPYQGVKKKPEDKKRRAYVPMHQDGSNVIPDLSSSVPALSNATPQHDFSPEEIDWDDPHDPWNPHSISPAVWSCGDYLSSATPPVSPKPSNSPIPSTPASPDQDYSETHRIDHRCIGKHPEHPKPNSEQGLMVVTSGCDQHIGKFVRCIYYFYNEQRTQESRWFILGVVDHSGRDDRLTKEYLELPPTDMDLVEESKEDREAGNRLFEDIRYSAKVGNPAIRRPGEGNLVFL